MANYYQSSLTLKGERETMEKIFDSIKNDEDKRVIDFDKVIPMPDELNIESNSAAEIIIILLMRQAGFMMFGPYSPEVKDAWERYEKMDDQRKEENEALAKKYLMNIAKYDYPNWYSWHIAKWGTKWNSIEGYGTQRREGDTIYFETANGFCEPVIEELSKKYPDVEFIYEAADEDIGSNTIKGTYKNGEFDGVHEHRTPAAFDIAFEMYPEQKKDFRQLEDGTWEYNEEE
jgi:hypothetical protein